MSSRIHLLPSGHEFTAETGESVLDAALRAGLNLDYRCDNGTCGQCKGRLLHGHLQKLRPHDFVLGEADKTMGYTLLCCYGASTDVVIEAHEASVPGDIPHQQVPARVRKCEPLSATVTGLHLRTPRSRSLRFLAGQQVILELPEHNIRRRLSIASCPCDSMNLQFHLEHDETAPFTTLFRNGMSGVKDVQVDGPYGDFILDEESPRSILFIANGIGFAPVKSLLEHTLSLEQYHSIYLYWTAHGDDGHYLHNYCRSLDDALDNFSYFPLGAADDPAGMDSMVNQISAKHAPLEGFDVYLSGPAAWLRPFTARLHTAGLPQAQLHSEPLVR